MRELQVENVAAALDCERAQRNAVTTFVEGLDQALGGGVPRGCTTEVLGPPGVGKTQFALGLAVNAQLPERCGGLGARSALYLDAEGSFSVERVRQIAQAAVRYARRAAGESAAGEFTVERVLAGIKLMRVWSLAELLAYSHAIHRHLHELPAEERPALIVVDSVAAHLRHSGLPSSAVVGFGQRMAAVAHDFNIAVVYINHVTTRVISAGETADAMTFLVPTLGEAWSHCAQNRISMWWNADGQTVAALIKSPSRPNAAVPFQTTVAGVRGLR
mmetsp:Transcript_49319/g.121020  ORF Transcript_49319/g.121020 Transcript_49319/m.121020 type:complete len:274 (+) Transcript_49319:533-1354(+)